MKMNDLFSDLLPEEQELSSEAKTRILHTVMESKRKRHSIRPVRLALIAAVLVILLCASVVAVYKIDWNESYREFFNVKSEDVQGFVEYPEVEVTDIPTFQPVSCVTGVQTLRIRFAYGPVSEEEAEKLSSHIDTVENCVILSEEMLLVEVVELVNWGPHYVHANEYDTETGMALFSFETWYEELPEQLTINISKVRTETLEQIEELGTLVVHPEVSELKEAELNLPITGPDGKEGAILAFRVDSGSYCWVYDIPGIEDWNGDVDAMIRDKENGNYVFEFTNAAFERYQRDSFITFADGTTRIIGGGLGPMWDGEHLCDWGGGGVYDIDNIVSITINGVEYPFSDIDNG